MQSGMLSRVGPGNMSYMGMVTFPATQHCHCPVLIPSPTEGMRLSWPEWLVTYRGMWWCTVACRRRNGAVPGRRHL